MNIKSTHRRSFTWLNITQFFGALNDNVFQLLCIFFLTWLMSAESNPAVQSTIMLETTIAFVLPFLLFSHAGGVLADRYSKRNVIVFTKCLEVVVMTGGLIAIIMAGPFSRYIMLAMIFLMCTQSAIFGPSKYGIIPELIDRDKLSKANGLLVGLTYLSIIFGTFLPSVVLVRFFPGNYLALAVFCVIISIVGLLSSLAIDKTPAAGNMRSFTRPFFLADIFKTLVRLKKDRYLFLTILASAYFLYIAAFIKWNMLLYGQHYLGMSPEASGFLFPMAALGIGIGAISAGKISGRHIEFGLIPLAATGLTVSCILLGLASTSMTTVLIIILLIGISSGLFIVPINAFIQYSAPKEQRGEIMACQNFIGFIGVILGVMTLKFFTSICHVSSSRSFLVVGILTGILALLTLRVLPDFFVRLVVILISRIFYRIKVRGLENLPINGPALLVSNHVTWVDTLLISAHTHRRIRFIMSRDVYETMWIKPILRLMKVITISPNDPPREIATSLKNARNALNGGDLVCIFAEGTLTRNGNMLSFKPGLEHILKGTHHPIIPIHLGGAWGSIFSHYYGKLAPRLPRKIPYHTSVIFGKPMPSETRSEEIRNTIMELSCQSYEMKKTKKRNLAHRFVATARKRWHHQAIADSTGRKMTFGKTFTAALALGDRISQIDPDTNKIGILLPASVGSALANLAITLQGRVPVNLNFTASESAINSAISQCGIKTVITSKAFIEKLNSFRPPEDKTHYMEDLSAGITTGDKLRALCKAHFARASSLAKSPITDPDNLATVIFSSGSTGEPKGVMLSHHNILSNIEAINELFKFMKNDRMCGILPFFHSFGFMATLWCPLTLGFSAFYHPNPIDGSRIAEIVRENKLTTLLATPTFLLAYIRRAKREDFASLRVVVVGAEKLKKKVADTFEEKFGLRPLEGYGATELSPVVAFNVMDAESAGVTQTGTKEGSIGHPIPGVAVKIVDPDTGKTLPFNSEGLVMVKGPNVMMGYLNSPEKTAEVLDYGWYNTGDIGKMDNDGFVFLIDRLSRYSKIGGEMVPHIAVEEKIMDALGAVGPVVFVTAAPDEKKGEQLVVLYTPEAGDADNLREIIKSSDLPNLWKPKKDNFFEVPDLPTLGSGKLDLKTLKSIAGEYIANRPGLVQKTINVIRDSI